MKLKDLINKIEKANKLNEELEVADKINLVLTERYGTPIRIYSKKDVKKIEDYFINEIAEKIINNELEKVERYTYKILDTEFELVLEF